MRLCPVLVVLLVLTSSSVAVLAPQTPPGTPAINGVSSDAAVPSPRGAVAAGKRRKPPAGPVTGPIEPEQSLDYLEVDPGLTVELVAAEPDVIDPVAAAFDEQGRLWVVEMTDYPNGPKENEPPRSRIRVLTPLKDKPGRFGAARTFADNLLFANGLLHWQGGVIVTADASVQYLKDEDSDGRADRHEVWFSGFVKGNPQLRCNHPTLGPDGRIYVANGLRGGSIVPNKEKWGEERPPVSISGMDFCFDPFTGKCEAVSGLGQFGLCFDDFGNRFVCSNRNPCRHIVLEDRDIKRNPTLVVTSVMEEVSAPAEKSHIYAISRPWTTSTQHAGQFTAACGMSIFRGTGLTPDYRNNLFVCEPTANVVHRDALVPSGATFTSRPQTEPREFLASRDEWFRPVYTFSGPDGALYICDMYRAVIEHPEYMPEELKTRPDLALGSDRGRIYRVRSATVPPVGEPGPLPKDLGDTELMAMVQSDNAWQRETAARLLVERGKEALPAGLREPLPRGVSSNPVERVLIYSILEGTKSVTPDDIFLALRSRSPQIQAAGARLAARHLGPANDAAAREALLAIPPDSPDGALRFQTALALGAFSTVDAKTLDWLASALVAAPDDHWLTTAVATSVPRDGARLARLYWKRLSSNRSASLAEPTPGRRQQIRDIFAQAAAQTDREELKGLLVDVATTAPMENDNELGPVGLEGIARGLKTRGERIAPLLADLPQQPATFVRGMFDAAGTMAGKDSVPLSRRIDALRLVALAPPEMIAPAVTPLLSSSTHELAAAAIEALGASNDAKVPELLLEGYGRRTPALRSVILGQLLTSEPRVRALVAAMEEGTVSLRELDSGRLTALQRQKAPDLKERIDKLVKAAAPADRSTVLAEYQPVLQMKGDPLKGRELFAKNCVTCHKIGDLGVNVAPDIADSRVKTPVQLLTDILDPNKAIDNNYFSYTVVDQQGQIHTGILSAETASSVTLRQPENKTVSILRSDIDEIRSNGVSLMPVGFEKSIAPQQMADLISFIKNWRYLDGQVPKDVIR